MSDYQKVVWNEGLLLTPQHFQQWDRYQEDCLKYKVHYLQSYDHGLIELDIDTEALNNGTFKLKTCEAVLPDGLIIRVPARDNAPATRALEKPFTAAKDGVLSAYLASPAVHVGAANCYLDKNQGQSNGEVRYSGEFVEVPDENTGANRREVLTACKNLKILFSGESLDDHSHLKIAEIIKTPTGGFQPGAEFIPTCLAVSASTTLQYILDDLVSRLCEKSRSLAAKRRQRSSGLAEFGSDDIHIYWLLHTVNSAIPLLSHFAKAEIVHPEAVFAAMSRLASELTTFSIDEHPENLPDYEHHNLTMTFSALSQKIKTLLEVVLPENFVVIPLEETEDAYWIARIEDSRLFSAADFYLAVRAARPDVEIIEEIPQNAKISSLDAIQDLMHMALPGIRLSHTTRPPSPLPVQMGFQYFRLENHGDAWEGAQKSKSLAINIPDDLPELEIKLIALKNL